jgi:hypothetical protein
MARQGAADGQGRGNFDPAQMQQRMLERYKEVLEVTDDAEWKAMEPLVQKVMDLRRQSFSGMGRGMFGRGPRGGDNPQPEATRASNVAAGSFGTPNPEADALQKAIDSKASKAEMKAALEKYVGIPQNQARRRWNRPKPTCARC